MLNLLRQPFIPVSREANGFAPMRCSWYTCFLFLSGEAFAEASR